MAGLSASVLSLRSRLPGGALGSLALCLRARGGRNLSGRNLALTWAQAFQFSDLGPPHMQARLELVVVGGGGRGGFSPGPAKSTHLSLQSVWEEPQRPGLLVLSLPSLRLGLPGAGELYKPRAPSPQYHPSPWRTHILFSPKCLGLSHHCL